MKGSRPARPTRPVPPGIAVAAILAAGLVAGCGLILIPDLSGVVCFPDQENQVIAEQARPSIRFAFTPDRGSVEAIFGVTGTSGRVAGRYEWEGNTVSFVPEPHLFFGRRYVMSFAGSFRDERGTEYDIQRVVPFFVGSDSPQALYVVATDPVSGGIVARDQEIRVEFSRPVDPLSAAEGLSPSPDAGRSLSWEDGDRTLLVSPREGWQHLCVYTLRLEQALRDTDGAPLAREEQLVFLVQEDTVAPVVEGLVPAFNDPLSGFPEIGSPIEAGLGVHDAIRIQFSEAMDRDATEEGFSLVPGVAGELLWPDDRTLVFAPASGYQAGVIYTILLSERVCDRCGNSLAGYAAVSFVAGAPPIQVTTTFLEDGTVILPGEYSTVTPRTVRLGATGECNLLVALAGGSFDTPEEKQAVLESITILGLFPLSAVPAPELIGFSWEGDTRLSLTYSDLRLSTPAQSTYYLLRIRGGPQGVATDDGNRLEEDLEQLLRWEEAVP